MPKTTKTDSYRTIYRILCVSPFRQKSEHPDQTLEIEAGSLQEAMELAKDQMGDKEGPEAAEEYTYQHTGIEEVEAPATPEAI